MSIFNRIKSQIKSICTRKKVKPTMDFNLFRNLYQTSSSETAAAIMVVEYIRKFSHDFAFLNKLFHLMSNEMMTNNILAIQLAKQNFPQKGLNIIKNTTDKKLYWLYFSAIWNMCRYEAARNLLKIKYIKDLVKISNTIFALDNRCINTYMGALSNLSLKPDFKHHIADIDFNQEIPMSDDNKATFAGLLANLFVDDDIITEIIDSKLVDKVIKCDKSTTDLHLWRNYLAMIQNAIQKIQYKLVKFNQIAKFKELEKFLEDEDINDTNGLSFMLGTIKDHLDIENFDDNKLESAIKYCYTDLVRDYIYEDIDLNEKPYLDLAFDYMDGEDIIKMLIFGGAKIQNNIDDEDKEIYKKYLTQKQMIHNTYKQKIKVEFDGVKKNYEHHLLGVINSYIDIRPDVF